MQNPFALIKCRLSEKLNEVAELMEPRKKKRKGIERKRKRKNNHNNRKEKKNTPQLQRSQNNHKICERVDEKLWKNYFDHETAFFSLDMFYNFCSFTRSFVYSFACSFLCLWAFWLFFLYSSFPANIFRIFVTLWFAPVCWIPKLFCGL